MNISDLFKGEHGMINEEELVTLCYLSDEKLNLIGLSEERLEEISKELDVDLEFLFFDPNGGINPYCYWNGLVYYRFISLEMDYLQMNLGDSGFTISKQFKKIKERIEYLIEEERWEEAISLSDKKVSFLVFRELIGDIPDDIQKKLFLDIYRRNEYGFDRLDIDTVRSILYLPTPKEHDFRNFDGEPDEDGYYIVYRGQTEKSSPLHKAYSWTFSMETAEYFATRFRSNGIIIKGKVHKDKIKAFIEGESEVLVFPEDIEVID